MSIVADSTRWACVGVERAAANLCHVVFHCLVHARHPACTWVASIGLEMDVFHDEAASSTNL
jgi:hypothetical protein